MLGSANIPNAIEYDSKKDIRFRGENIY